MNNERGNIWVGMFLLLWFLIVLVGAMAYFLYNNNYLHVRIGPPEEKKVVFDENTVKQLKKREEEVEKRQKRVERREAELNKLIEQLDIERAKIKEDREEISAHLSKISSFFDRFTKEEEENFNKLAKMYEAMKADKVATIFEELDIDTIAELLKRIKTRNSAKILAAIGQRNADRAALISDVIKGEEKSKAFVNALK